MATSPADILAHLPADLIYYVVFLFSTTVHEAGHAWAATLGGDLTAYHGGQVSLDPRAHIRREPFGMLVLPILSVLLSGWPFGYASAPFDPYWALHHPKRAGWMALAGPAGNLLLVLIAALVLRVGMAMHVFYAPESIGFDHLVGAKGGLWSAIAFMASVFFSMNLVLASLNLIPLPPLDGSAAVTVLLPERTAARYQAFFLQNRGTFSLLGIFVAWRIFDGIYQPLFVFAANLLHWGAHYG